MKVLVTGAGGFVGRHLVQHLTEAGHPVVAWLGPEDGDLNWPGVTSLRGDVRDSELAASALVAVDALVHAAGPASVAPSFTDPTAFASVHVAGTATVLRAAANAGLSCAVYISSAEIYGNASGDLVDEDTAFGPLSPYGAAKLGAEWMARTIAVAAGLPLTILRPFSLYGPGQRQNSLLGTLLTQVRERPAVELFDLSPVRDYLHIEDFCRLVLASLTQAAPLRVLNACSGVGVSVGELAQIALAAAGRDLEVRAVGKQRPTDMNRLIGSRWAAESALDWRPEITLTDGLRRMLAP